MRQKNTQWIVLGFLVVVGFIALPFLIEGY